MSLIKLPQIQGGARLAHANTKKYNVQKFSMTDTATTEFTITNKPDDTDYTQIYDTNDGMAQIEINHNMYYQDEDFTFDKSSGKIIWTNTAANKGFDLTKDLCDSIRIFYAYTYEYEKILNHNRYVFNKNNNVGPINIDINGKTYYFEPPFEPPNDCISLDDNILTLTFGDRDIFSNTAIYKNKDLGKNYPTEDMFFETGILKTFFENHKVTITREKDGAGLEMPFKSVGGEVMMDYVYWTTKNAKQVTNTTCTFDDLKTAYNNGENLVFEVVQ